MSQASNEAGFSEFTMLNLALGAVEGGSSVSGNGGDVTVIHTNGLLQPAGIGSTAIYAQSVGAGGGRAGNGAMGQGGEVNVGGSGDAAGDGGDVTVRVSGSSSEGISILTGESAADGDIGDMTVASYGIFAQSVGGGGGHAGNVTMGTNDFSLYGAGLAMTSSTTTATGNGGDVLVELGSNLQTFGKDSIGIFAQSIGGGGGIQGEVTQNPTGAKIGSNGGAGAAGSVTVNVSGTVTTTGQSAHGVFAQSVGGAGTTTTTDTKVSVNVTGSINASGGGANAIFAQSSGDGKGPIAVTIGEGAQVIHGAGFASNGCCEGAGVVIQEGTNNTITNAGLIQLSGEPDAASGVAIRVVDAPGVTEPSQVAITNSGTIDGSICVDSAMDQNQSCTDESQTAPTVLDVCTLGANQ